MFIKIKFIKQIFSILPAIPGTNVPTLLYSVLLSGEFITANVVSVNPYPCFIVGAFNLFATIFAISSDRGAAPHLIKDINEFLIFDKIKSNSFNKNLFLLKIFFEFTKSL